MQVDKVIPRTAVVNEPTACLRDTPNSGDTERGRAEGDDFKVAHVSQKKSVFVEVPFVPFGMANSMQAGLVASSSARPGTFPAIVIGGLMVGAVDLLLRDCRVQSSPPHSPSADHRQRYSRR